MSATIAFSARIAAPWPSTNPASAGNSKTAVICALITELSSRYRLSKVGPQGRPMEKECNYGTTGGKSIGIQIESSKRIVFRRLRRLTAREVSWPSASLPSFCSTKWQNLIPIPGINRSSVPQELTSVRAKKLHLGVSDCHFMSLSAPQESCTLLLLFWTMSLVRKSTLYLSAG
jgi:hypothetical protein